jgi:hypothetical protein
MPANSLVENLQSARTKKVTSILTHQLLPSVHSKVVVWKSELTLYPSEGPGGKVSLVEFRSLEDKLHPCSNAILSANKYIRKMKGGSQSILVRANDGKHYVVKMADNPIGPNVLANEFMGSSIAKAAGLPVAEAKGIVISDSFIESHPDLWFELQSGKRRPNKGVHFASLLVGQTSGTERPFEYVSPSRVHLVTNREAFLGMYILDIWANHQDNRQAVFRRRPDNTLEAFFIDHGHMFGGPEWNFNATSLSALHLELEIYRDLWQEDKITSWVSRFQTVVPGVLRRIADPMDSKWYSGDLAALIDRLTKRLAELPELVQTDLARISRQFPRNRIEETLRQSKSGLHNIGAPDTRSSLSRSRATA